MNLTRQTTYDAALGLPTSATMPKAGSGVRHTDYYKTTGYAAGCQTGGREHGMPCKSYVTASGLSDDLPAPAEKTFTYNREMQVETTTRKADGQVVTRKNTYGPNGEPYTTQTTGNGASSAGLVLAYGFEEASGTSATDSSGNGRTGTLQAGATRVTHGRYGRAIKFDGVDDQVAVLDNAALDLGDLTLEAWVKSDNRAGTRTVFSRGSTTTGCTGPAYGLRLVDGMPSGGSCGTWYSASTSVSNPDAAQNIWTHVALTRQGTNLKIYRDGRQVHSVSGSSPQANDTASLLIGAGSTGKFSGLIDEVRVYGRALTQAEVDANMRRPVIEGSKHVIPATTGLLAAYGFDEKASSQTLEDGSGNANHGVVNTGKRVVAGAAGGAFAPFGDTVTGNSSLEIVNSFTAETWLAINRDDVGCVSFCPFLSNVKVLDGGNFDITYSPSSGVVSAYVRNSGGRYGVNTASGTVPYNRTKAVHIAATYDGTTLALYVDGVLKASRAAIGTLTDADGNIVFGDTTMTDMWPFLIDEVKVFDHARTPAQLATDANVPVGDTLEVVTDGEPLAQTTFVYDAATGLPTEQKTTENGVTRSVVMGYDSMGRVTSYTDADGNVSTTSYDLLGRPTTISDGKGTQTYGYDAVTGEVTSVQDSQAGTFSAAYDIDGKLLSQTYPNGLKAETTYSEVGAPTALTYTKTTNCSSNCVWYSEEIQESIRGQWTHRDSSLSDQDYTYDRAGRLTLVEDTPAGQGCTTRSYAFDGNSNRTSRVTRAPGAGGACDTSSAGQTQSSTYDALDRATNTGIVYDTWGRMKVLPASLAGGSDLKTTYYVNDMVRTQSQGAVSKGWLLDPTQNRYRATIPSGTTQEIMHYSDGSDSPAWTEVKVNGSTQSWERPVTGIAGLGAVVSNDGTTTTTKLQIANLHGDIVATADPNPAVTALLSTFESRRVREPAQRVDECGVWLPGVEGAPHGPGERSHPDGRPLLRSGHGPLYLNRSDSRRLGERLRLCQCRPRQLARSRWTPREAEVSCLQRACSAQGGGRQHAGFDQPDHRVVCA